MYVEEGMVVGAIIRDKETGTGYKLSGVLVATLAKRPERKGYRGTEFWLKCDIHRLKWLKNFGIKKIFKDEYSIQVCVLYFNGESFRKDVVYFRPWFSDEYTVTSYTLEELTEQ